MVVKAARGQFVQHRYNYTDTEKNQFIWIELRSTTAYDNNTYDWSVWVKTENLGVQGHFRDRTWTIERLPSNFMALLALVQVELDLMKQEEINSA